MPLFILLAARPAALATILATVAARRTVERRVAEIAHGNGNEPDERPTRRARAAERRAWRRVGMVEVAS